MRYWFGDSQTGTLLNQVKPESGSFTNQLGSTPGSGEHTFKLRSDSPITGSLWRDLTTPWSRMLVAIDDDDTAQYAGLVTGHSWDHATGELSVRHSELRVMAGRRFPFMVPFFTPIPDEGGVTTISGKSIRGLLREVYSIGFRRTAGDSWHFPVVLPADESGSFSKQWFWYEFPTIADMIQELEETNGGPDTYLSPRRTSDGIVWDLQIGNPRLSNGVIDVPRSRMLSGYKQDTDGLPQMSGVFALGKGSEADMRVGKAGGADVPGVRAPVMDRSTSVKNLDDVGQLNAAAVELLRTVVDPKVSWEFGIRNILPPVGSTIHYWDQGDEFVVGGVYRDAYVLARTVTVGSEEIGLVLQ